MFPCRDFKRLKDATCFLYFRQLLHINLINFIFLTISRSAVTYAIFCEIFAKYRSSYCDQ